MTKGPGSRAAGLAMAFKLIQAAQDRWRAVNAPELVALVRAGARFVNGKLLCGHHGGRWDRSLSIASPSVLTVLPVRAPVAGRSPRWNSARRRYAAVSCRRRASTLLGSGRLAG